MRIILASGSPRRRELLSMLGVPFSVQPSQADETIPPGARPADAVVALARRKAEAVWARLDEGERRDAAVVAADTVVAIDGDILGKPQDADQALAMLKRLRGRTHLVYTGVCVRTASAEEAAFAETQVRMRPRDDAWLRRYVATGEPMDKAGAYAIQGYGSLLVDSIAGDYYNVVGLPLGLLDEMFGRLGLPLTALGPSV
ncbi:Maf family protein [Alicyclobacillus acidocaldarius]|uniref:dTTP/UTP pyrophosphatase n=1 Tax=Alicyclobacillus acidocaldarius subsp. acidocaldarius (strain ATCC 27009 / DSM 446 / BCRC 14685 / JCM 5260 / KCTC 1825 / NBRC 15652 / NCIMB 11725 / NRRL B-14509 / 104-IA) TaxID=521098 RepID=C8WUV7_ALIAD|nr:Maf family protein [Alicyclobacillus acidocaldarius]ACV57946.1 maf protein [Alicyclobacillus acidocaldarius subsp. acidocaldarius DSM 446]